ncbi:hypothetical protein Taro_002539 [Colocasia esculenta]|uniref:Uncharacterized protein n=1 Tax=Colocasia esculenta TaxID=4460 RepID=A0A843TLT2_COLES|nr:hypothetical protein [Colocasia esculenta]
MLPTALRTSSASRRSTGGRDFMRPARDARDDLIDTLRAQLVGTEAQLAEAREALDVLATVERTDAVGASSSQSAPDPEMTSFWAQLAVAVARAETAERDLTARDSDMPHEAMKLRVTLSLERRDHTREQARRDQERSRWDQEQERLTQQAVEARTSLGIFERLLREAEDRYRRGHERTVREGQASAYSGSYIATSSQYLRNIEEGISLPKGTVPLMDPYTPSRNWSSLHNLKRNYNTLDTTRVRRVRKLKKLFVPSLLLLDLLVQGLSFSSSKLQKVSRVG